MYTHGHNISLLSAISDQTVVYLSGQEVNILPKGTDKVSTPWTETVRTWVSPERGAEGIWTMSGNFYPAHRVSAK